VAFEVTETVQVEEAGAGDSVNMLLHTSQLAVLSRTMQSPTVE